MALLLASTLASGGLVGVAGVVAWRKGLLRKHYAALLGDVIYAGDAMAGSADGCEARAEAFQLFEVDPSTQQLLLASVGLPVRFGAPVVVVHAETSQAIRFQTRGDGATVGKLPVALDVQKAHAGLVKLETTAVKLQPLGPPQHSTASHAATDEKHGVRMSKPRVQRYLPTFLRLRLAPRAHAVAAPRANTMTLNELRGPVFTSTGTTIQSQARLGSPRPASSTSVLDVSFDAPCKLHTASTSPSFRGLRRRRKTLQHVEQQPREAPVETGSSQLYVVFIQPVVRASGGLNAGVASTGVSDEFLRWGTPMSLVADMSGRGCGLRPREYSKDSKLYLTTRASPTTLLPLREDGDRSFLTREVVASPRQVRLSVGTYNVWMMPRVVSAFTSISPKKNTRARLIADVLPPCDVWVLTECFDHRARQILLDKMAAAGYAFVSPTVGHKRHRGSLRKALNGGVVLASKYPILSVRVKLFGAASAGADKLADKGVLYCKILKDGLLVHVFSTHLQAWNSPLARTMRKTQMQMIADFVQVMDIDTENDAVLFAGDLNVDFWLNQTNNEYDEMLEIFEATDSRVAATDVMESKRARRFSFDPRVNALAAEGLSTDGSLELLDYVLYSRVHRQPREAASWIQPLTASTPWFWRGQPQYNLSDHFPVVSDFTFDM